MIGASCLSASAAKKLLKNLGDPKPSVGSQGPAPWKLLPGAKAIQVEYRLKNFREAVRFLRIVARLAETANHHPDLHLTRYRFVKVVLTTHAVRGLSSKDFVLAAQIQKLLLRSK